MGKEEILEIISKKQEYIVPSCELDEAINELLNLFKRNEELLDKAYNCILPTYKLIGDMYLLLRDKYFDESQTTQNAFLWLAGFEGEYHEGD